MAKSKKNVRKASKKSAKQPAKKIKIVTETKTRAVTIAIPAAAPAEPPANTTLDTLYIVNASPNDVTLEVNAGAAGQTSDMTIRLDNEIIAENLAGDFREKKIGTNNQLNGKKLSIVATIADTSGETNLTSLTIRIKGGVIPAVFPLSKTVANDGESADYLCLIEFFKP